MNLSDYENAAVSAGYTIRNRKRNRFNLSSEACHSGDSHTGVWVVERDGNAAAHCHVCPFPESDKNVRATLHLPTFGPPQPTGPGDLQASQTEKWLYRHPKTREEALHTVFRHPMRCWRDDCDDLYPHKHSTIKRENSDEPLSDGFAIKFHKLPDTADDALVVVCEGQKTAEAVAEIGLIGVSYIQGSGYASKADYSALRGREMVVVAPDNDAAGEKAALESAIKILELGVPNVRVLDHTLFPPFGGDIADIAAASRLYYINEGNARSFSDVAGANIALAVVILNHRCSGHPRSKLTLIEASSDHILEEQVDTAWDAVIAHHVQGKRNPTLYEYQGIVSGLEQTTTGFRPIKHDRVTGRLMSSEAIEWYKGWEDVHVTFGAATDEGMSEDIQALVLKALQEAEPVAHGKVMHKDAKEVKGLWEAEEWYIRCPKYVFPNQTVVDALVSSIRADGSPYHYF